MYDLQEMPAQKTYNYSKNHPKQTTTNINSNTQNQHIISTHNYPNNYNSYYNYNKIRW